MPGISYWEIFVRIAIATLVGGVIGWERERRHKPVGVRTHILIILSATVLSIISAYGFSQFFAEGINQDPARLVVGVLTGIGFIGAGIIWKSPSGSVQGITTAAEIFLLTAIGIAIGLGLYFIAIITASITILTLESEILTKFIYRRRQSLKLKKKIEDDNNHPEERKEKQEATD